jgi:hypothetical protein
MAYGKVPLMVVPNAGQMDARSLSEK